MTDRELLELAAFAAGLKIDKSPHNGGGHGNDGFDVAGNAVLDWHNGKTWNPLTDDGDALRLAVGLSMQIWHNTGGTVSAMPKCDVIGFWNRLRDDLDPDPYAATRRAIVRAAAEIGRSMKAAKE